MLDLKQDWSKLPSRTTMQSEARIRELDRPPSPDVQSKWDIPELVVVGAAVSGRIVQEGQETRNFALDFDSFERAAVEAVQAGAAFIHIDTGGIAAIMESGLSVPRIYDKLTSGIGQKLAALDLDWVPDANILRGETFAENLYPITAGLVETAMMAPRFPLEWMEATAKAVDESGCKLFLVIHTAAEVELAQRLILSKGLLTPPICWDVLIGYPYDETTNIQGTYIKHPRAMMDELALIVDRIREVDPDGFVMVNASGRAGHYLAVQAMLMGLHVRTGTEDMAFRFPHKDELIESNLETMLRARMTAEVLGRRLATPDEYRQMIGLRPRSDNA